ncbi:MAG: hypothetical protein IKJ01_02075 [Lachnospiraceae bacterium]|nr:hypothetical protein [Lachnospiraceae bacterium]
MKSNKIFIFLSIIVVLAIIFGVRHFQMREDIPENTLQIETKEETYLVDITQLSYKQVTGTRVNGKGEEKQVEGQGILLKELFFQQNISDFSKAIILADDSYQVEVTAEEIHQEEKVYLFYEENELRLIVFGDKDSKRSVSNVVEIKVE